MTLTEFIASESSRKPHFLLIGSPIGHSISPMIHNIALEHHNIPATYHAVGVKNSELTALVSHFNALNFMGANVTIPYKEVLYEAVDSLGMEAGQIGAVNTILKTNGKIRGENTDAYGFSKPLQELAHELMGNRAIIFGTGGATKAIVFALLEMGLDEIILVSRRPENYNFSDPHIQMCSYDQWKDYAEDASLIVNATPLGMTPATDASPVRDNESRVLAHKICYDIVYNPLQTKFLTQASEAGGIPIGGLNMLIYQAAKAFKLWTDKEFPIDLVKSKLKEVFSHA